MVTIKKMLRDDYGICFVSADTATFCYWPYSFCYFNNFVCMCYYITLGGGFPYQATGLDTRTRNLPL